MTLLLRSGEYKRKRKLAGPAGLEANLDANCRAEKEIDDATTAVSQVLRWLKDLLLHGYKHGIVADDLYDVLPQHWSELLCDNLEKVWSEELNNAESQGRKPSLWKIIFKTYGLSYLKYSMLSITDATYFGTTVIKYRYFVELRVRRRIIISADWAADWIPLFLQQDTSSCYITRLSFLSVNNNTSGMIMNLMSTDMQNFEYTCYLLSFAIFSPIDLLITAYILQRYVGYAAYVAVSLMVIQILQKKTKFHFKFRSNFILLLKSHDQLLYEIALFYKLMSKFQVQQTAQTDKRISLISEEFLLLDEVNLNVKKTKSADTCVALEKVILSQSTQMFDVEFSNSKLYFIVGSVGSGKTTLLNVILGEIRPQSGELLVSGKISYESQEPWIVAASIRENIIFGEKYDKENFQLPYGDKTQVGERGLSLSGGQRARVNLARAVYRNADIYLIDDPLSAVDAHVAKDIFENCINGYLSDKTRILVTNNFQFLKEADEIILLNDGKVEFKGNPTDFYENKNFCNYLPSTKEKKEVISDEKLDPNKSDNSDDPTNLQKDIEHLDEQ
ncbi:hypothetical protein TSAR_009220 [Trichomalopsis sarcophagae]|uniref:ABC transporter domain-containing protein n=1 Tax=Trichomalopsis sarcophagae TaxID=543379 RepID=A0A232FF82_9HYME|nr:hypothetical protein TSAR_009220 [Trichomalopsis sarcophagae]